MSLFSGLQAGANFVTGYNQGQQQYLVNQMNQLQLQNQQLAYAQNVNKQRLEQNMADFAMNQWNPTITNPTTGQTIGGQQPNPIQLAQQRAMAMAQHAAGSGIPGSAEVAAQWDTNAANLQAMQQRSQLEQSQLQAQQLKQSAALAQQGVQDSYLFPNTVQGGQQFLAYEASQGLSGPGLAAMSRYIQANPNGWQQGVREHGMKAMSQYQQFQQQQSQQKFTAEQQYREQQHNDRMAALQQREQAEAQRAASRKATGDRALPLPSQKEMMLQAYQAAAQKLGIPVKADASGNPSFGNAADDSLVNNLIANSIAATKRNPNLTFPAALRQQMAAEQAAGNFQQVPNKPTFMQNLMGQPGTGTTTSYATNPHGQSMENPIPYQKGMPLIIGSYYTINGGVFLNTGKGLTRVR